MANKFSDILQMIHNTQIRTAIDKMGSLCGLSGSSITGSSLTTNVTGNVTGNLTGNVTGNVTGTIEARGSAVSAEHGAGAIGTYSPPLTYRYVMNGDVITEIHVDLTGLACKGDAADDVIGLAAGGAAYIGQYVVATCGFVYKAELICAETPTEETATITTDINVTMNSSALLAYDGAASNSYLFNTGGLVAGGGFQSIGPGLTADDYIYLTEGDTAGSTGEYSGGQIILRLFGHRGF